MTSASIVSYQNLLSKIESKYPDFETLEMTISTDEQGHQLEFEQTRCKLIDFARSIFHDFFHAPDLNREQFLAKVTRAVNDNLIRFRESRRGGIAWFFQSTADKVVAKCGGAERESLKDQIIKPFLGKVCALAQHPQAYALFATDAVQNNEAIVQATLRSKFPYFLEDFNKILQSEQRYIGKSIVENFGSDIFESDTRKSLIDEWCTTWGAAKIKQPSDIPGERSEWKELFTKWKEDHPEGNFYQFLTDVEVQETIGPRALLLALGKKIDDLSFDTLDQLEQCPMISTRDNKNGEVRGALLKKIFSMWKMFRLGATFYDFLTRPMTSDLHLFIFKESLPRFQSLLRFSLNVEELETLTFPSPDDQEFVFSQAALEEKKKKIIDASLAVMRDLICKSYLPNAVMPAWLTPVPPASAAASSLPSPALISAQPQPLQRRNCFLEAEDQWNVSDKVTTRSVAIAFIESYLNTEDLQQVALAWRVEYDKVNNEHQLCVPNSYTLSLKDVCLDVSQQMTKAPSIHTFQDPLEIRREIQRCESVQLILTQIEVVIEKYRDARRGSWENVFADSHRQSIKQDILPHLEKAQELIASRLEALHSLPISDL